MTASDYKQLQENLKPAKLVNEVLLIWKLPVKNSSY